MRRSFLPALLLSTLPVLAEGPAREPVLVELFTSEGCSSCPPADRLLRELHSSQPVAGAEVVPIAHHVDYWNRLGWADPFSSRASTERQGAYARAFGGANASGGSRVYTPQMVVDGHFELIGSDDGRARRAIASAARDRKPRIQLASGPQAGRRLPLELDVPPLGAGPLGLFVVVTEDALETDVPRGENAGKRLSHTAVARRMVDLGEVPAGLAFQRRTFLDLDARWTIARLAVVAFVQDLRTQRVLALSRIGL